MEHLDRDEEDQEGEASANARNKAITSLLKGSKPSNHNHNNHTAPVETDEEESEDEDPPAVRILKSRDYSEDLHIRFPVFELLLNRLWALMRSCRFDIWSTQQK